MLAYLSKKVSQSPDPMAQLISYSSLRLLFQINSNFNAFHGIKNRSVYCDFVMASDFLQGWIACGGEAGLLKVLKLETSSGPDARIMVRFTQFQSLLPFIFLLSR
jgi:hypothetical protein